MNFPSPPQSDSGAQVKDNDNTLSAQPNLLDGIAKASEAELSLLLKAFVRILSAHHGVIATVSQNKHHPMAKGLNAMQTWAHWQGELAIVSNGSPQERSTCVGAVKDAAGMREMVIAVSKATLYHALVECAALQRRLVTGKPYGPYPTESGTHYDTSDIMTEAIDGQRAGTVRYTAYKPMDRLVVHTLCAYAKRNHRLVLNDITATLIEVHQWRTVILPDIRRHIHAVRVACGKTP